MYTKNNPFKYWCNSWLTNYRRCIKYALGSVQSFCMVWTAHTWLEIVRSNQHIQLSTDTVEKGSFVVKWERNTAAWRTTINVKYSCYSDMFKQAYVAPYSIVTEELKLVFAPWYICYWMLAAAWALASSCANRRDARLMVIAADRRSSSPSREP